MERGSRGPHQEASPATPPVDLSRTWSYPWGVNSALTSKGLAALYSQQHETGSIIPPLPGEVLDAVRSVDASAKQLDAEIQTKKDKLDATFLAAWSAWIVNWTAYQKSHNSITSVIPTGGTLREVEGWRAQLSALYATYEQRLSSSGDKPATPPPSPVPFVAPPAPPKPPAPEEKDKKKLFGLFELPEIDVPWWVIAGLTAGAIGGGALLIWWLVQQQKAGRETRAILRESLPHFLRSGSSSGVTHRPVEYIDAEPVSRPLLTSGDPSPSDVAKSWKDELPSQRYHRAVMKESPLVVDEERNEKVFTRRRRSF